MREGTTYGQAEEGGRGARADAGGDGSLRLLAPAKLNLTLHVTGRRADGFHELDSVMVLLDLADELRLAAGAPGLEISREDGGGGPALPQQERNLAWRGLVAGGGGEGDGARGGALSLIKRIPIEAGLGGGSSDAAAAWRLARRWAGRSDAASGTDLAALSAIGADIPFFATRLPRARVRGIGERVERTSLPGTARDEVVLAIPPFRLSTAAVFAELRRGEWGSHPQNDLLAPARRLAPALDDVLAAMRTAGEEPALTGSGPCLFFLLGDPERADAVAGRLRQTGLRVVRTRLRREAASIRSVTPTGADR